MKHHGVVTKTRTQARSVRPSAERLPASAPMTPLNIPATRSSTGFWNQYQAFLNSTTTTTTTKPHEEPASSTQAQNEAARSPLPSDVEPKAPNEARGDSGEGR